ncbi:MAG: AarF/ABC1/UbiB kinase family protein [Myxococcales bacterium]|nr:AarF/ABC1/UbiB kinase family protein [Myxococcales bacterium]
MADELPKGRIARGLALVKLAARELPTVANRVMRDNAPPLDALLVKESAERAVKVLGDLRGLAMKIGQTASYVDGLLPPEATEVYQKTLSKLQSQAPTVSFEEIRTEIERGLGRPLAEAFVRFDETPVAAASIGQVHRAAIADPDRPAGPPLEVAVKVQYPSIAQALHSDLKNLESLRPMLAVLAPGADTRGGLEEVVKHIAAELDYTEEARNQDLFRGLIENIPGMMVPRVYHSHTAKNVLTMEFIEGRTVRAVAEQEGEAFRNKVGEAIFRFTLGLAFGRGVFNTDPHPGNYLVRDDATVAFLDFGSVKVMPRALHAQWRTLATHLVEGQHEAWRALSSQLLGMEHMDPQVRKLHQDQMLQTAAMLSRDAAVCIDREMLRDAVRGGIHNAKEIIKVAGWAPSRSKTMNIPPDFVMVGRMQLGLFAVLATLRPTNNWNQILRDMLTRGLVPDAALAAKQDTVEPSPGEG